METTLNLGVTLTFLHQLSQNNNKTWFDSHRQAYEEARACFFELIERVIDEFRIADQLFELTPKACAARIYRDIRFSKDKTPYKTNLSALVTRGGWKGGPFGYFISIEPGGQTMVAGGLYDPSPEQLYRFRQAIDEHPAEFREILQAPEFLEVFGEISGEKLKTAPKGYEKDHPEIDLLRLKQVTVIHRFTDEEVVAGSFENQVMAACYAMQPFLAYLKRVTE